MASVYDWQDDETRLQNCRDTLQVLTLKQQLHKLKQQLHNDRTELESARRDKDRAASSIEQCNTEEIECEGIIADSRSKCLRGMLIFPSCIILIKIYLDFLEWRGNCLSASRDCDIFPAFLLFCSAVWGGGFFVKLQADEFREQSHRLEEVRSAKERAADELQSAQCREADQISAVQTAEGELSRFRSQFVGHRHLREALDRPWNYSDQEATQQALAKTSHQVDVLQGAKKLRAISDRLRRCSNQVAIGCQRSTSTTPGAAKRLEQAKEKHEYLRELLSTKQQQHSELLRSYHHWYERDGYCSRCDHAPCCCCQGCSCWPCECPCSSCGSSDYSDHNDYYKYYDNSYDDEWG
eukprot:Skav204098  [mRNA]  locus=scaffold3129:516135:517190:+ [translate_table: standard]